MAKRRKKVVEEEEKKEIFEEPEFDVRDFLIKEMKKAKGIIIVFIISLVLGIISGYLQVYVSVYLGAVLGFVFIFLLKPILAKAKAEFSDKKTWFYAITMFLLIWFLGWTIALNPPLNDISPPQIRSVQVYNGTAWIEIYSASSGIHHKNIDKLHWNGLMSVRVLATDNVGVDEVKINGHKAVFKDGYYVVYNIKIYGKITVEAWDVNAANSSNINEHYTKLEITVPTGK